MICIIIIVLHRDAAGPCTCRAFSMVQKVAEQSASKAADASSELMPYERA